ncbi:MAG: C39 family peptidase [archaeon]
MKDINIPLMKQGKNECGPTALSMILKYLGKNISKEEITRRIGGLKKYGVRTIKLAEFAKNLNFDVHCYSNNKKLAKGKVIIKKPNKSDIIDFLEKGLPVILAVRSYVLFNRGQSEDGHFIVITGYNDNKFRYTDPFDGKRKDIDKNKLMRGLNENSRDSSAYLLAIKPKE